MSGIRLLVWSLFLYGLSYVALTLGGRYEDNVTTLSKINGPCLCISDKEYWQPAYIAYASYSGKVYLNGPAIFYWPLVVFDQAFLHQTRPLGSSK